ncbi:MAG TPA: hypothetical protein VLB84_06125, partial [Bacteroidia bacterium]|nr:hypothetical protein [Bacteroidia bacterium]
IEVAATYAHPCLSSQPQNFGSYTKYAAFKPTFNPTEWFYMDTTITYEYDTQNTNSKNTKTVYVYSNAQHMQLSQSYFTNSNGKNVLKFYRYPIDYSYIGTLSGTAFAMKEMTNRHIYNRPVEETNILVSSMQPTISQTEALLHTYKLNNNQIVKDADYRLKNSNTGNNEEAISNYVYASIPGGQLVYDTRYELENQYTRYDLNQNLTELKQQDNTYAFRCPVNGDVWATTRHAGFDETAYSSFEHGNIPNDFTNWNYNNANVFTDATPPPQRGTFNGDKCYKFSGTSDVISNRIALNYYQKFKFSFWGKNGTVSANVFYSGVFSSPGTNVPLRTGPTRMGWTYYEGYFTNANFLQLNGTGMIDELRLYPASARMETFVYRQGIGLWSKCNENNQNTFWNYDEFQRVRLVSDQDGYILNKAEYKYLQQQN